MSPAPPFELARFFVFEADGLPLLEGQYDPWLVTLSVAVAVFSAILALQLVDLARASPPRPRRLALLAGSVALGAGIWAMHFIAMLAIDLCTPVRYAPGLTALSMLPSIAASWVALTQLAGGRLGLARLLWAGALVGAGIGTMHYSGMAAMRMAPLLRYDPAIFALSIVVAVALASLALWVRFGLVERLRPLHALVLGGLLLGLAVTAMHYTGMAAARFVGQADPSYVAAEHGQWTLALAIALAAVVVSVLATGVNAFLRFRTLNARLARNEARQRAIVDTAVDAVLSIDARGNILSANRACEALFGWRAEELLGRNVSMLMPSPYREEHDGYLAAYLSGGPAKVIGAGREITGQHRDGSLLPMRLTVGRVEIEGEILFVGFISDLRQRRAMEDAVRASEQQFRSLIGNIPGVTFRCRHAPDWPMIFISDPVEALTGWPAEDFLAQRRSFTDSIHPDDRDLVGELVAEALAQRRAYKIEYRTLHRDGSERWVAEFGGGVYAEDSGELQWIDGVILDVTEAKLQQAEFVGVVAALSRAMGVIEFDLDGRILHANHNFLALTGYRLDELLGQHHDLLCDATERDSPALAEQWDALRRGHFVAGEYRRLGQGGRPIWVQASYNPIFDAEARPRKIVSFVTDLSARRAMEEDLRHAKERAEQAALARSRFLATMSHEIRTPMNAIIGFADLLRETDLRHEQQRHLDVVRSSARSLLALVNDILDSARMDGGGMSLERHPFSLRGLIAQLCSAQGVAASSKGVALRIDYPPSVPEHFIGDALRVQQVLLNLVGNAVKFTERGSVTVRVRQHPGEVAIEVIDSGIGIAPERLPHIFDPFVQADASTTRRFGGTGLGTTIARQLAELMGGRIEVSSVPGEGSVFRVQLPLPVCDAPADAEPATSSVRLPPLRVLVADDVAQNLELVSALLGRDGHRVDCVADGSEALQAATAARYDVILMDVHMPGMDGLAAARAIRAIEAGAGLPAVPILALTASVLADDRAAAEAAGMSGFASKPVELPALYAEIARVLGLGDAGSVRATQAEAPAAAAMVINLRRARSLWPDREAWLGALQRFLAECLAECLAAWPEPAGRDLAPVRGRAHALRGNAANLGLDDLAARYAVIESAARAGDRGAVVAAQAQLSAALRQALREAEALQPSATRDSALSVRPTGASSVEILALIDAALVALRRGELPETEVDRLAVALPDKALDAVQRALAEFDSDGAQRGLHILRASISGSTKQEAP